MIKKIEEDTDGQIREEDWYPVPFVYSISKFVESFKDEKQVEFTASPKCGGATYAFVEDEELIPITEFMDVEGFIEFMKELSEEEGILKKAKNTVSLARNLSKYIDEEKSPEGLNVKDLILSALKKGNYDKLGKFHENSLFLGSMWSQDAWNLDLDRLSKCVIHYSTPEGIVPFCTYNGINVGQDIREKHSIPVEEWEEKTGKKAEDDLWENGPIS